MQRLTRIVPPDETAMTRAREKWDEIAKPLGSLGLLEESIVRIAGMTGSEDVLLEKRRVIVMCADNGVIAEGVSQSGSDVTAIVARAVAEGHSNINMMAAVCGAEVKAVDVGMAQTLHLPRLAEHKTACGTCNIAHGSAMTVSQAETAIAVGMDEVRDAVAEGCRILVTGEMGIGNTTTASAVTSVLLGLAPADVTGRGAGLDSAGLRRKIAAIESAIAVNRPDWRHPLELIAKVGGFDIAAMTGMFLGGAVYHVPVVIDGFISAAAAALAAAICPAAKDYMLCSHVSGEPAARLLLDSLGLKPLLTAELRLGEGTGGVLLLPLLDSALAVYHSAHRFAQLPMERYVALS